VIVGVGIDVVDVARFVETLHRVPALRERLFTPEEREMPETSLAARFAAKEAIAKALGAPVGLQWHDATVRRGEDGRPHLEVTGTVEARAEALGVHAMHVSLSHDAGIASAVVVAEG
jgi:holo-[acyl-carrier protein] synthase